MKKLSLIVALVFGGLVACSLMVNAQEAKGKGKGGKGGRMTVEQQMEQLSTNLNLTDEQKPKVKAVLEDTSKKMQEIFSSAGGNREEAMKKMQPVREEQTAKLKGILNADQFAKWQKMEEERRARMGGGKGGKKKAE